MDLQTYMTRLESEPAWSADNYPVFLKAPYEYVFKDVVMNPPFFSNPFEIEFGHFLPDGTPISSFDIGQGKVIAQMQGGVCEYDSTKDYPDFTIQNHQLATYTMGFCLHSRVLNGDIMVTEKVFTQTLLDICKYAVAKEVPLCLPGTATMDFKTKTYDPDSIVTHLS
jgi:hypothetical protein